MTNGVVDTTARDSRATKSRRIRALQPKPKSPRFALGKLLFYGIMAGCGSGLAVIAFMNIQPYRLALEKVISSMAPGAMGWPSVQVFLALFGTCIFLSFQALEIMPGLIKSSRAALLAILADIQSAPSEVAENDEDSQIIRKLKTALNQIPEEQVKLLFRLKSWAYAGDGLICWFVFPPLKEGAKLIGFSLIHDIDWVNLTLIVLTLFACEAICKVIGVVWGARFWIKAIGSDG